MNNTNSAENDVLQPTKIYLFAGWNYPAAQQLGSKLLHLVEHHPDLVWGGCVLQQPNVSRVAKLRHQLARFVESVRTLLSFEVPNEVTIRAVNSPAPVSADEIFETRHLLTQEQAVNDQYPNKALVSILWTAKFSDQLLGSFHQAVNYHNGSVPNFRGLRATSWSIYKRSTHSGFTFHRIDSSLDTGPVLAAGEVEILRTDTKNSLELAKTTLAITQLPTLLTAIVELRLGLEQTHTDRYLHSRDAKKLCVIEHGHHISLHELNHRIRAFGSVRLRLRGDLFCTPTLPLQANRPYILPNNRSLALQDKTGYLALRDLVRVWLRRHDSAFRSSR